MNWIRVLIAAVIYNSQEMKVIQIFINMDKQIMAELCYRWVFGNKKQRTTDKHETWLHLQKVFWTDRASRRGAQTVWVYW